LASAPYSEHPTPSFLSLKSFLRIAKAFMQNAPTRHKGDVFDHFIYIAKIATSSKGNPDVPPNAISL
jgi:hypothetical protein